MSNANETEMTLKRAHEIIGQVESLSGNTKEYPLAYWEARALIAGHAAASKEAEVYREALEKIVSGYMNPMQLSKEALSKGRKPS